MRIRKRGIIPNCSKPYLKKTDELSPVLAWNTKNEESFSCSQRQTSRHSTCFDVFLKEERVLDTGLVALQRESSQECNEWGDPLLWFLLCEASSLYRPTLCFYRNLASKNKALISKLFVKNASLPLSFGLFGSIFKFCFYFQLFIF